MPAPEELLPLHVCLQVIAIDVDDPLAKDLNDIADVEKHLPGYVSGIREWFRWYKTPDDKPLNGFGFDERALDKVRRTLGVCARSGASRWRCQDAWPAGMLVFRCCGWCFVLSRAIENDDSAVV